MINALAKINNVFLVFGRHILYFLMAPSISTGNCLSHYRKKVTTAVTLVSFFFSFQYPMYTKKVNV